MQQFYKGRTNNHLTWAMVDATDFATPESALSAAMKIKIYGKLRGATGVNFVSSGTGSLTNDIQHVGASALGLYTIALAKADLSDASAAWYDQYIISLSATGAALQALIVDGGIDASTILALSGLISDAHSAAVQANSRVLIAQSGASDAASAATQANSRVLLVQSRLSDLDSRLSSELSDALSGITALSDAVSNAYSAAVVGASRVLLVQSRLSDLDSRLVSDISDVRSMLSDMMSDFQSRVPKAVATNSQLSDLHSDLRSFLAVMSGIQSDIYSQLSDFRSDLGSVIGTTGVQLNASSLSDIRSAIADITVSVSASDISDIASAVRATVASDLSDILSAAVQTNSRVLLVQSRLSDLDSRLSSDTSDLYSLLSDLNSNILSRVPKEVASKSLLSDVNSDLASKIAAITATLSASDISDIASAVWANTIGARVDSRVLVLQSYASDIRSHLSDLQSDFQSRVPKRVATDSQLSDVHSDLKSAIGAITVSLDASNISDIASAVVAALPITSMVSDAHSAAAQANSRILVIQSRLSDLDSRLAVEVPDIYSLLSDHHSDFQSRIPKAAATASALALAASVISDAHSAAAQGNSRALLLASQVSDLQSQVAAGVAIDASSLSDIRSAVLSLSGLISDAHSAAAAGASRALLVQSQVSDIYSLLSDLHSDVGVLSGVQSDVYSLLQAGAPLGASDLSDLRSVITANGVLRSGSEPVGVVGHTDTHAAKVDYLTALAVNKQTLDKDTGIAILRNEADNANLASRLDTDDGTTYTKGAFA